MSVGLYFKTVDTSEGFDVRAYSRLTDGFVGVIECEEFGDEWYSVEWLSVNEDVQRQGIATALWNDASAEAKRRGKTLIHDDDLTWEGSDFVHSLPGQQMQKGMFGPITLRGMAEDYRGQHQPSGDYGAPMHDLTVLVPDDIYTHPQYYPGFDEWPEMKRIVQQAKGNPNMMVTVYRAVPRGVTTINPGDWVTPSKGYAEEHGRSNLGTLDREGEWVEDYQVIQRQVRAGELIWPGDYAPEWGWFPNHSLGSTSWRPYSHDLFWREHDVVITSEGGGSGRRAYEVFVNGWVIATRPRLDEAKQAAENHVGKPLDFKQSQTEPYELQPGDHAYETWGDTEEFTSPSTIWTASI